MRITYGEIESGLKYSRDFISLIGNGLTPRKEAILGLRIRQLLQSEKALAAKDAEIAKLREALSAILGYDRNFYDNGRPGYEKIARDALNGGAS